MTDPQTPTPPAPANGAAIAQPQAPTQPASPPAAPSAPGQVTPPAQPAAPPTPPGAPPAQPSTPGPDAGKGGGVAEPKPVTPAKPDGAAPAVPETYDLKLPKDSPLPSQRVEEIKALAKEQGLTNEQAQAKLTSEHETISRFQQGQTETLKQAQARWVETAEADPEIGGEKFKENVELAKRVIARYGTDSLKKELDLTQYGNHPELLRIFNRIGRAMSEDQLVLPEGGSAPRKYARAEDLYDHPTSKKG